MQWKINIENDSFIFFMSCIFFSAANITSERQSSISFNYRLFVVCINILTIWIRSLPKWELIINSVPQRNHNTCPLHTKTNRLTLFKEIIVVRFQVLTAMSMKSTAFWDTGPCSLVEVYRRFRSACIGTDDGGSTHLRNVGILQRGYTVLYARRLSSSKIIVACSENHTKSIEKYKTQNYWF
jgi:hypothetical protein